MKLLHFLAGCVVCAVIVACSTDFDLEAEWKDIPVVHGFLSKQDTAHYLRVEKAFLAPGTDAVKIAKIADSLYYDAKVQVQLQRLSNGQIFTLRRVDGTIEGYPRREGIFATQPNILYKIPATDIKLRAGERIRLIINRGEGKTPVTAETVVLDDITPRETSPATPVNFGYDRNVSFAWDTDANARIFDLRLILNYRESTPGNPANFTRKQLIWVVNPEILRDENAPTRVSYNLRGEEFYRFLQSNLSPVSDRIRIFDTFDIQITGAGQELADFLRISRANGGITSAQFVPIYSNISEGRGIFSARSTAVRTGLTLNSASLDSLRNGVYTRSLNFK